MKKVTKLNVEQLKTIIESIVKKRLVEGEAIYGADSSGAAPPPGASLGENETSDDMLYDDDDGGFEDF